MMSALSPPVPHGYRIILVDDQDGGPLWIAIDDQTPDGGLPRSISPREWEEGAALFAWEQWLRSLPDYTLLWDGQRWKDADQCFVLGGGEDPA